MDLVDLKIIQLLDVNCRDSFANIGLNLGVSSRTVQRRVAEMVATGFIRRFEVTVDPSALNLGEAVCDIQVRINARNAVVRQDLLKMPNLTQIITLAGGTFVGYLYYRDPMDLERSLNELSATPGVADVQYELSPRTSKESPRISRQGWLIVQSLNHRARRELVDVSKDIGLSSRTVQRTIRWLTASSAIRFGVDIDVSKAENLFIYVLIARLQHGVAKQRILERVTSSVRTVWRELRSVSPYALILLLYSRNTTELGSDVEAVRSITGVAGVRVLLITGDETNPSLIDSRIAEKAKE